MSSNSSISQGYRHGTLFLPNAVSLTHECAEPESAGHWWHHVARLRVETRQPRWVRQRRCHVAVNLLALYSPIKGPRRKQSPLEAGSRDMLLGLVDDFKHDTRTWSCSDTLTENTLILYSQHTEGTRKANQHICSCYEVNGALLWERTSKKPSIRPPSSCLEDYFFIITSHCQMVTLQSRFASLQISLQGMKKEALR